MSELRHPNESREYRDARDLLLKEEQELVEKTKSVAAKRRQLPLGGELKEDYLFEWANDGKVGEKVKFSELFGDKETLLIYSFMFGQTGTTPALPARRLSMGSIAPGIRSASMLPLSPSLKPRQIGSMPGQKSGAGRRSLCFRDTTLPTRWTTDARKNPMTCNYRSCMCSESRTERFFIFGEPRE
jgi:hypothetical protein